MAGVNSGNPPPTSDRMMVFAAIALFAKDLYTATSARSTP
jgi:hypothetical protein